MRQEAIAQLAVDVQEAGASNKQRNNDERYHEKGAAAHCRVRLVEMMQ